MLNQEKGKLDLQIKNVREKRNAISRKIGNFKRKSTPTESDFTENEKNLKTRDVLNRYLATINNVVALSQYKKGSGVRKHKQPKRNAYNIQDKSYGNLSIDVPKLMNEMKLDVRRGGKIICQANADK